MFMILNEHENNNLKTNFRNLCSFTDFFFSVSVLQLYSRDNFFCTAVFFSCSVLQRKKKLFQFYRFLYCSCIQEIIFSALQFFVFVRY